jgi:hypothetical protein
MNGGVVSSVCVGSKENIWYYTETSKLHLNSFIVPLNIVNNAADKKEIGVQLNNIKICGPFLTLMDHFYKHEDL